MSAHVLLGHFRLWMSTVWVARWIGFKFLIPELIGKSKIRSLEVKEDENHKSTLFRDTLYINLNFILENFYWDDWDDFGRRGWPNLQLIQEAPTGSGYAVHFFDIIYFVKNSLSVPITCLNGQSGLVISNMSNRSQGTSNWLKIYWRTSSYAVYFLTFFVFVKNSFSVPIICLNCQNGLVISKIYQTEAKEPQIDWKCTGVRARTPCIFWHFLFLY